MRQRVSVEKCEGGNILFDRPNHRWEDNVKTYAGRAWS